MIVLSVSTSDRGGGAEQVAWDVFTGLEALGHESWLAVGQKHSSHPRVVEIHASPWFKYEPFEEPGLQKRWTSLRQWRQRRGFEDFFHPYSRFLPELLPHPPDVVLAHNLHGGFFDLRSLPGLSRRVPVATVLHDYWMLTGHCAYPFECDRWRRGCGQCPHLDTPPAIVRDATRTNLRVKRSLYRRSHFTVCSPSEILLKEAKESALAEGAKQFRRIPNGVDLETFRPGGRDAARRRLGLPMEGACILLVGRHFEGNPFKDYGCATECARRLAEVGEEATFVLLGAETSADRNLGSVRFLSVPFASDRAEVADYYRACDLLLHASRQEVAPLVLSEAMACGLPSVTSDVGNARSLLGDAGLIVPVGDAGAHAEAVSRLLSNGALRKEMGRCARARALAQGGREHMVFAYERLLLDLAGNVGEGWSPRESTMPESDPPHLTVVYPVTDVRGHAAEHLSAWTTGQKLEDSRYVVIAVVESGDAEAEAMRKVLRPQDILLPVPTNSDVAMWNAGGERARTPWLLFAEGHSPGKPNCLQEVDRWLASDPEAEAGNIAIGHPDSYQMADLSDRWFGEQQARWGEEWPRLHRAGFVIRRSVFHRLKGFPSLGQFGPPLLSARLHREGLRVVPIPGAEVTHIDDETVHDHHADTLDFVAHECEARAVEDPVFFERYFGHQPDWRNRLTRSSGVAWSTAWAAVVSALFDRDRPRGLFRAAGRLAVQGLGHVSWWNRAKSWRTKFDEGWLLRIPFLPEEMRYRWFVAAHRRVVEGGVRNWVRENGAKYEGDSGLEKGKWAIESISPDAMSGLHGLETLEGIRFRWSEPLVKIGLTPARRERRIRIETGGLRPSVRKVVILAACGPHPLPRYCVKKEPGEILSVRIPKRFWKRAAEHGLALVCVPLRPAKGGAEDDRELGFPIVSVEVE